MNSLVWTLLVIFIPNGIGFIIYFLTRQPLLQSHRMKKAWDKML
jgi:hypothetical protein